MEALTGIDYLFNTHQRVFWLYLLTSLLIALFYVGRQGERLGSYFSKAVWWHPSARTDYGYFVVISIIKITVIIPLLISSKEVALGVTLGLQELFGYRPALDWNRQILIGTYTLALFVVSDFTRYWLHRLMHTVPLLWRFHRVHHSAEVLNPLTFYRVHPVENLLFGLRYALSAGGVTGVFIFFFGARIGVAEVIGVNAFVFAFAAAGANLRHSHLPLRFGNRLEQWIVSPYMHQFHHAREGVRSNYGGALAVWDRLFGTLHVEETRPLLFGLGEERRGIVSLLVDPFRIKKTTQKGFAL